MLHFPKNNAQKVIKNAEKTRKMRGYPPIFSVHRGWGFENIVPSGSCVRSSKQQGVSQGKCGQFRRRSRLVFPHFAMRAAWLRAISHTTPARHYSMLAFDGLLVLVGGVMMIPKPCSMTSTAIRRCSYSAERELCAK